MKEYTTEYLSHLRESLTQYFNKDEFFTMCADLSVNFDELSGEGLSAKARELVAFLNRRNRLDELITLCGELRPNVAWHGKITTKKGQYCTGCGSFSTGFSFCPNCGARLKSKDWEIEVVGIDADEVQRVAQGIIQSMSEPKDSSHENKPTIICELCGFENPIGSRFCQKCGRIISDGA